MNAANKPKVRQFALLLSLSLLVYGIGLSSLWVEKLYSRGLYPITAVIQRWISSFFPFALGDFLYLLLIAFTIRSLYLFYRKIVQKKLRRADRINIPLQVINFFLILYLLFKILWGLNYSRPSISSQLGISDERYNTEELVLLGEYFITKINELQLSKKTELKQAKETGFNIDELELKSKEAYDKMKNVNSFFQYTSPTVKSVLNGWVVTKIGIEGYYNPLSGEANVNMKLPGMTLPFVTCHEIAHQLGIGREDEANLIGYLVAANSDDPYFRYSASYNMLRSILFEIRMKSPEDYQRLFATINPGTLADFKEERDFWQKYNSDMYGYMGAALDGFLKLNNQKKGTDSYQDIVLWLYNIHKKELNKRAKAEIPTSKPQTSSSNKETLSPKAKTLQP